MRDVLPRHVIMFYYPTTTTVEMGPTAVLPGACYFSTDRAGFMQSEEQLSPELLPPPPLGDDDAWDTRVRRHMVRNFV